MSHTRVLSIIKELDSFKLNVTSYYSDGEYSSFSDSLVLPKVKALRSYLHRLGMNDLVEEIDKIELEPGRLITIIETLRGFIIPEAKERVEILAREPNPDEPELPASEQVIPRSLVRGTRGYIEKIVYQINGSYEHGWFDACAVMIRRLVETLIIEVFEEKNIADKIKGPTGDFLYLRDLVSKTLAESSWNLGRNAKSALPQLKDIGDQSAHSRRFMAQRRDIERIIAPLRTAVQELMILAGLK
jgi:hypothetical protein